VKARKQGFSTEFTVVQGDALAMPFRDETFQGAMVAFGMRNIPNMEVFLDEIQKLPNWADLLKTYYDIEENLKIFISGSASLEIKEYKETLAGRILTFYLTVISFKEFVRYFGMDCEVTENEV
jgi:predicted AAA+ superfamily ATPase